MSSREADEAVPDEPLEPLLDVVDKDVREETRDTSRTNLAAVGYTGGNSPVAERTSSAIVNLPCHPRVTLADVARYVELLARVEG